MRAASLATRKKPYSAHGVLWNPSDIDRARPSVVSRMAAATGRPPRAEGPFGAVHNHYAPSPSNA